MDAAAVLIILSFVIPPMLLAYLINDKLGKISIVPCLIAGVIVAIRILK
ncbi:MAG: hypothetical protein SOY48_08975 [Eubacterium sp.]|nr:hypothetical protein [Eubacterium sp.]MDD6567781.1 hypothetical protein [Eubacteriales bacterium]MDY4110997.1 hypothetical protein [Eubacterium sp.]